MRDLLSACQAAVSAGRLVLAEVRRPGFMVAALLALVSGSSLPVHAATSPQELKPRQELLFDDLESVRAVVTDAGGSSIAIGALVTPIDGSGVLLVWLDGGLRETKRAPLSKPKVAAGETLRRTVLEGASQIENGDVIVFGNAEIGGSGGSVRRDGWAALIGRDGRERWNRVWPANLSAREEYLYFARTLPGGAILLGGKRQAGSKCTDASSGVAFEVEPSSGAMRGERRLFTGGATRQGFRDAAVRADGYVIFSGWIGGTTAADRCRDDAWLLDVSPAKSDGVTRRIRGPDGDALLAYAGVADAGPRFVGFLSNGRAGSTDGLVATVPQLGAVDWTTVAPTVGGRARFESAARMSVGEVVASMGHIAAGAAAGTSESGWLRLHHAAGLCGHDFKTVASLDTRLLAADMVAGASAVRMVLAGQARRAGARTSIGWIGAADVATSTGNLGSLAASGERTALVVTAAAAGGPARASLKLTVPVASPVRIVASPLTRTDVILAVRAETGQTMWVGDLPWTGPDVVQRSFPPGEYRIDIISAEAEVMVAVTAAVASTVDAVTPLETTAIRPLVADAIDMLGFSGGAGSSIDVAAIVAGLAERTCHSGERIDGLRALFVAAAERAATRGKDAAASWRRLSGSANIVTRELVGGAEGGEAATGPGEAAGSPPFGTIRYIDAPGRDTVLGEVRITGGYVYEGELSIALAERHKPRMEFSQPLIDGFGVRRGSGGVVVSGHFTDKHIDGAAELRTGNGDVHRGLIAEHFSPDAVESEVSGAFGAVVRGGGSIAVDGSAGKAIRPCRLGASRSGAPTQLLCEIGQGEGEIASIEAGETGGDGETATDGQDGGGVADGGGVD